MSESELEAMVLELRPVVVGLHAQRLIQTDQHTLALRLMRHWVALSAHPELSRLHPLSSAPRALERPPAFCMLLRKTLLNRPLLSLDRVQDRVVVFEFSSGKLVAELMGRRANLLLLDRDGVLLGALRGRNLRAPVGQQYTPPPAGPAPRPRGAQFGDGAEAEALYGQALLELQRRQLTTRCSRGLRKARRTCAQVERDLERCRGAEQYKKWADLLLAHQRDLPQGQRSVEVADLFTDGSPITIPLDPRLEIMANAQRLYRQHRRLRTGEQHATRRLKQAGQRVQLVASLLDQLAQATDQSQLDQLQQQLDALVPLPHQAAARAGAPRADRSVRSFRSRDGLAIMVGRSARDNHHLTFHLARGRDLWLHLRDRPGSHGVVRVEGARADVPQETLLDAATLVAHFSKVKVGDGVDVAYTWRKNVRPANQPGQVYLSEAKNLHLVLEQERLARLLSRSG